MKKDELKEKIKAGLKDKLRRSQPGYTPTDVAALIASTRFREEPNGARVYSGLTDYEVERLKARGEVNQIKSSSDRSYFDIIKSNIFSFFNLINVILAVLVFSVHSYKNALFIFVAVANTCIGIFQEIRAKIVLDRLRLLNIAEITVIRNEKRQKVIVTDLVKGDVAILRSGDQVPADAVILEGVSEVNESLLTGESDTVSKGPGKQLLSGSFISGGEVLCVLTAVGSESYIEQLAARAKEFRTVQTVLQKHQDTILKVIAIIIIPMGLALFARRFWLEDAPYQEAVLNTVAAVLGMIPEGLVLLTSVSLAVGAVKLARHHSLVRELFSIEMLARVDTLCLDKTGTITEGKFTFLGEEAFQEGEAIRPVLSRVVSALPAENETIRTLKSAYPAVSVPGQARVIPFSSEKKYSGVILPGEGTYLLGASQSLLPDCPEEITARLSAWQDEGIRVLCLVHSERAKGESPSSGDYRLLGFVLLEDRIRKNAPDILRYFKEQDVSLRLISGDDPRTVSAIAAKAGIENAGKFVDMSRVQTEEEMRNALEEGVIFGRVTPIQKQQMVLMLKEAGHTVAMTGDGVNDVLALKDADVGIAMASGSSAAKNTANLVLMDSDFASLPLAVNEGRRVINNIKAASSMFLIKTGFSLLTALLTILLGQPYPFEPIELSVINACAVGIPTFLIQFEANYSRVDSHYFRAVFRNALPPALLITALAYLIQYFGLRIGVEPRLNSTLCVLTTGWIYLDCLQRTYQPPTAYRKIVITLMHGVFLGALLSTKKLLQFSVMPINSVVILLAVISFSPLVLDFLGKIYDICIAKRAGKNRGN